MNEMGEYEIMSHVEMPECSIRIISMKPADQVNLHFHRKSAQIYTVLQHEVEARVGDRTMRLRPYETVRIEKEVPHCVRAVEGGALVLSLSIPPLFRDDQHVAE